MKQLYTRWGKNLDPKNILPEHPNPLCRREHFTILNGTWHYAITDSASRPGKPPFRRQPTASAGAVSLVREISSEDRHP